MPVAFKELKVGQQVEATVDNALQRAAIRYLGEVPSSGQKGDYVGLELAVPAGKNDGSAKGERYFECSPLHGIFVRPEKIVRIISQPPHKAATRPAATKVAISKPGSSSSRSRPGSAAAIKSAPQSSRLSAAGGSRTASIQSRLSTAAKAPAAAAQPSRPPSTASKTSATATQPKRLSISGSSQTSNTLRPAIRKASTSSTSSVETRSTTTVPAKAPAERTRQISELEYRRLQKQQEHSAQLEEEAQRLRTDNEKAKSILTKLEAKCHHQYREINGLHEQIKQLESENEKQAKELQDREEVLELATIDREMAEEQRDQLEAELETERALVEELRLELEIKQEEASFITDDMPEDQKQAAMLHQAQTERDRYREGIVRLRDMTREQIKDLETRIRELEAQVAHTESVEADLSAAHAKVTRLEAIVENLQEQVDASNEWEDMHEELIEKNQNLEDYLSQLQLERRELSTIIEVSNETINDYAEHADELQAELGTRDTQLAEVARELDEVQKENVQLQDLVSKHQAVSMELQSRLQELKADKAMTEEEVKDVTGRFNEVMELHRRLRNASVNDTNRQMDSSLLRLAAEEAKEELDMIKYYLSESSYADFNSSSIKAYFRAKAISFKASLTSSLLRTTTTDQFGTEQGPEQVLDVLVRHDVVGYLQYIHIYAEQIWNAMASCSSDEFVSVGALYQEFESVLRTVDGCMGALKRDALNLKETLDAARGSYYVMGAVYRVNRFLFNSRPDCTIILHVSIIRASLKRITSVFDAVNMFVSRIELVGEDDQGHLDLDSFMEPGKTAAEALNIATKFSNLLTALQKDGLCASLPNGIEGLVGYSDSLDRFANRVQESAAQLVRMVSDRYAKEPGRFNAKFMASQIDLFFSGDLPGDLHDHLKNAKASIGQWHEHASILVNCVEVQLQPAPWVIKAQQIEADKKHYIDAEKKLQLMTTELQSALLQLRERQETIDTKELEIEHLKARNQEAAVKAGTIETLQQELNKAIAERDTLVQETQAQEAEIARLSELQKYPGIHEPPAFMPPTPQPHVERPEDTQARTRTSTAFITFAKALEDENHWLRQREYLEMFESNLSVFTKMHHERALYAKAGSRHRQARAAEMLQMALTAHLGVAGLSTRPAQTPQMSVLEDNDFWSDNWTPDAKSTPVPPPRRATKTVTNRRISPFALPPIRTTSQPSLSYLEDLSFVDLSPVAEEFSSEMSEILEN